MTRASDTARLIGAGATINDGTTITTADNTTQLTLKSTDADGSSGPLLDLTRDSGSPADGDVTGIIRFRADNDAGEVTTTGQIVSLLNDASDGTEDGEIKIETTIAGSAQPRIDIIPSETVFNEGSVDVDLRVESNGLTHALLVDAGNDAVGINTSAASSGRRLHIEDGGTACGITLKDTAGSQFGINSDGGDLIFKSDTAGAERMRLDTNGHFRVGTQTHSGGFMFNVSSPNIGSTYGGISIQNLADSDGGYYMGFYKSNNTLLGKIVQNSSSVSYDTTSDYRLKENVVTDWDATTRLKQLKPSRFNFIADADTTLDGFLAHEVSSIVPEAISGKKDAVDKDGNINPQGIDQSKLVPLLTKSLQEALARIDTLEAEVAKLKG